METTYEVTKFVFQRSLGLIYVVAFLNIINQYLPLLGQHGLLPIRQYKRYVSFKNTPSLFWWKDSDRFILGIGWLGLIVSIAAMTGLSDAFGLTVSFLCWAFLWVIYLSFVNLGQTWYSFGWESMLLETGFLAIFLGSTNMEASPIMMWLILWISFRNMFGAGLIKLRGDPCWRDLTCLHVHYRTQPMPNPLSWYFDKCPSWWQKTCVAFNHVVELIVPFGLFAPAPFCYIAGGLIIYFQIMLILSGNLSFLNYLSIVICIPAFDDQFFQLISSWSPQIDVPVTGVYEVTLYLLLGIILVLSIEPILNLLSPRQAMNRSFDCLHLVNTYGAFGGVTKRRFEIIVEGSDDGVEWKEYQFKGKPGDVNACPPIVSPYHLRLDWLMWFAAMNSYHHHPWFVHLLAKLLKGEEHILSLMKYNPFPHQPPKWIRALRYEYQFSNFGDSSWWTRELIGEYFPKVSMDLESFQNLLAQRGWPS